MNTNPFLYGRAQYIINLHFLWIQHRDDRQVNNRQVNTLEKKYHPSKYNEVFSKTSAKWWVMLSQ